MLACRIPDRQAAWDRRIELLLPPSGSGGSHDEAFLKRNELHAVALMTLAATLFGISNTMVPVLAPVAAPVQIVVLANGIAILVALPWLGRTWRARFRAPWLVGAMMLASGVSNIVWFEALARVNVSLATALSFAAPLVAMPIAALILGEEVTARRWAAVAWGFAGTLVVLRPWQAGLDGSVWFAVAATIGFVGVYLTMRLLAGQETPARTVVMMSLGQMLSGLPLLPGAWRPLSIGTLGAIAVLAVLMQAGRAAMQRAYSLGRTSMVMPLDFLRLPAIALVAWVWIGQTPDVWTFAGAFMIVSATVALARL